MFYVYRYIREAGIEQKIFQTHDEDDAILMVDQLEELADSDVSFYYGQEDE